MSENWKKVPDFEAYEVSDLGNVRSWRSRNGRGGLASTPRLMAKSPIKGKDYLRVTLFDGTGTPTMFRIHQLVLLTFVGPCPAGQECRHRDGHGKNNVLTNLHYGTVQENSDDRIAHGMQVRGEQVSLAVLTEAQVAEIRMTISAGKWKHGTGRHFALKFGVSDGAISSIKRNKTWNHV